MYCVITDTAAYHRYSFVQVLACLLMCAGLVWFTLADSALQPNFDMWGQSGLELTRAPFNCLAHICVINVTVS